MQRGPKVNQAEEADGSSNEKGAQALVPSAKAEYPRDKEENAGAENPQGRVNDLSTGATGEQGMEVHDVCLADRRSCGVIERSGM